jgi:hypothetical protein
MPLSDPEKRKDYERERKQKRRIEKIMSLPETEQTIALERNQRRRGHSMRWKRHSSSPNDL